MLCIKVIDKNGLTINVRRDENEVHLSLFHEYQEGDQIIIEVSDTPVFAWLQLDDALGRSLVYLTGNLWYKIPFGEKRINLSPKAFAGGRHLLTLKKARDFEVNTYRNLAFNVNDCHENSTCFPHASANVETRGEAVFAAKNAIDGVTAATCHGEWPYASWGINFLGDQPESECGAHAGLWTRRHHRPDRHLSAGGFPARQLVEERPSDLLRRKRHGAYIHQDRDSAGIHI